MLWTGWPLRWNITSKNKDLDGPAELRIIFVSEIAILDNRELLHPDLDKAVRDMAIRKTFNGKSGETAILPTFGWIKEAYVLFIGCEETILSPREIRAAAGSAGGKLIKYRIKKAVVTVPERFTQSNVAWEQQAVASALMEGLLLGLYRRDSASKDGRVRAVIEEVSFVLDSEENTIQWMKGLEQGIVIADGVCYARELTNKPSNQLTPELLGEEAKALAGHYEMDYRIYDDTEATQEGIGGLLAVGKGSVNPPRMIVIQHKGNPNSKRTIGLIGKGVTFDTGGISLKKAAGMEEMISDMGGAAAVMGVMRAIGEWKPAINIVAVIPAAENMPSGSAFKPGDVIETYSGKTVEVLNTDAEGRIVLADGLTTALRHGATELIDIATLTGAVMHALGDVTTGALTNEESLMQTFLQAANRAGEYVWPLPNHPEYRSLLKSQVADIKNHGGAWAGAIAGGLFVGEFAEGHPWIHLDIGGTTWMWDDRGFDTRGGTGVMVRTLLEYVRSETVNS